MSVLSVLGVALTQMRRDVGVVDTLEYTNLTQQQLVGGGGDMDSGKDSGDGSNDKRLISILWNQSLSVWVVFVMQ